MSKSVNNPYGINDDIYDKLQYAIPAMYGDNPDEVLSSLDGQAVSDGKTLNSSFNWSITPQGYEYWEDLAEFIEAIYEPNQTESNEDLSIKIMEEAIALKKRKSKDYQGSQFSQDDYFPFGHQSYLHMLHTKMLRIRSVAEQETTNFESLEDSLIDMINYCAMYASAVRRDVL